MLLLGVLQAQAAGQVAAGSFDLLETQVLASSAASVTFSSLSTYAADYQHLQIRGVAKVDWPGTIQFMNIQFNATSMTKAHQLRGFGGSVSAQTNSFPAAYLSGNNNGGGFGGFVIDILDPFETTKNKTYRSLTGTTGTESIIELQSGFLDSTAAVSSITFTTQTANSFASLSRFSLYGIKAGS